MPWPPPPVAGDAREEGQRRVSGLECGGECGDALDRGGAVGGREERLHGADVSAPLGHIGAREHEEAQTHEDVARSVREEGLAGERLWYDALRELAELARCCARAALGEGRLGAGQRVEAHGFPRRVEPHDHDVVCAP